MIRVLLPHGRPAALRVAAVVVLGVVVERPPVQLIHNLQLILRVDRRLQAPHEPCQPPQRRLADRVVGFGVAHCANPRC